MYNIRCVFEVEKKRSTSATVPQWENITIHYLFVPGRYLCNPVTVKITIFNYTLDVTVSMMNTFVAIVLCLEVQCNNVFFNVVIKSWVFTK